MSFTYAERKKAGGARTDAAQTTASARLDALRSGAAKPTSAEKGHRVDLPEQMRARMESSFGADFSAVKLYESQAVADAGANAIAQGSSIAFAPGKADFTSRGGQELLGHELSHVASQQRGEVTGGGFLNDHALEARADREGAMAAAGESVYGGATAPLSAASAVSAAGPMQADRKKGKQEEPPISRAEQMNLEHAQKVKAKRKRYAPSGPRNIDLIGDKQTYSQYRYNKMWDSMTGGQKFGAVMKGLAKKTVGRPYMWYRENYGETKDIHKEKSTPEALATMDRADADFRMAQLDEEED